MRTNDYNTVGDAFGEFPAYTRGLREIAARFGYCFFPLRPRFRLFGLTGYSCAINAKNIFYFNGFRILLASLSLFFLFILLFTALSPAARCFPKANGTTHGRRGNVLLSGDSRTKIVHNETLIYDHET